MTAYTLSDIVGGGGISVKSLQRGVTDFNSTNYNRTITVSAVVMAMSLATVSFRTWGSGANQHPSVELTATTTLFFERGSNWNGTDEMSWQLIEYE